MKNLFCKNLGMWKANKAKFFYSRDFLGWRVWFMFYFIFLVLKIDNINSGVLYQMLNTAEKQPPVRARRTFTG